MMVNGRLLIGVLFMVCFYQVHVYGEIKTSPSRDKSLYFESLLDVIGEDNREARSSDNNLNDESFRSINLPYHNLNDDKVAPWFRDLMIKIVPALRPQLAPGKTQFGFLYLDHVAKGATTLKPVFYPNKNGAPIVDTHQNPTSPPLNTRINYLVARPYYDQSKKRMIHVESQLTDALNNLLHKYHTKFNTYPNVVILYTWLFPCKDCTDSIISGFQNKILKDVEFKIISYTKGTSQYAYGLDINNFCHNRDHLIADNLKVWEQYCNFKKNGIDIFCN